MIMKLRFRWAVLTLVLWPAVTFATLSASPLVKVGLAETEAVVAVLSSSGPAERQSFKIGTPKNTGDSLFAQSRSWCRTRFHLAGEVAIPSEPLDPLVNTPALGAALAVEFAGRNRLRPLLDLSLTMTLVLPLTSMMPTATVLVIRSSPSAISWCRTPLCL